MRVTAVVWGVDQQGTAEHAFPCARDRLQRPITDAPQAICGTAWSASYLPHRWSTEPLVRAMLDAEAAVECIPSCRPCQNLAAKLADSNRQSKER